MLRQPDGTTCGPTCLHGIYQYYNDPIALDEVTSQAGNVPWGGTLAVLLGCHALARGYSATAYSYNLGVFDPTWFHDTGEARPSLPDKLRARARLRRGPRHVAEIHGYREFLALGGRIRFDDLSEDLIAGHLVAGRPILAGVSATYLYRTPRERGKASVDDDVRGDPSGHFVVLTGYRARGRMVTVADPLDPNPPFHARVFDVGMDRLLGAIMLGVLTYDANLLVIEPPAPGAPPLRAVTGRPGMKRKGWTWRF